jgi:hypothetical protein
LAGVPAHAEVLRRGEWILEKHVSRKQNVGVSRHA